MPSTRAWLLVAVLGGCTSVKLVQREGCWVRQTEKWPGRLTEEIGPCTPPTPTWSEDRITRVVQECVARAEYRWQTRALIAWNRGEPLPERTSDAAVAQECMSEPARVIAGENETLRRKNEDMKDRLGEVAGERDALRSRAEEERAQRLAAEEKRIAGQEKIADRLLTGQEKLTEQLVSGQDRMAGYLGEAAKKSSQPAVATATATSTSDGAATTDSSATSPAMPAVLAAAPRGTAGAAAAPERPVRKARTTRATVRAKPVACPPAQAAAPEPPASP